jgi:hypothetical protein
VQNRSTVYIPADNSPIPPTARRSASTGALSESQYAAPRVPLRQQSYGVAAALPGPPPGPPPSSSRAASMSRASEDHQGFLPVASADVNNSNVPIIALPTRRPPHRGTQLGPVPPTPADWTEFPRSPGLPQARTPNRRIDSISPHPLTIQTGVNQTGPQRSEIGSIASSSTLNSSSHREGSVKPIRERRSESRAARDRHSEAHGTVESSQSSFIPSPEAISAKPADLVLSSPNNTTIGRHGAVKKSRTSPVDTRPGSRRGSSNKTSMHVEHTSTPPFSPESERKTSYSKPAAVPPIALPTPPPQAIHNHDYLSPSSSLGVRSPDERPISHILHTPNNEELSSKSLPLIPQKSAPSPILSTPKSTEGDLFNQNAIDRHRMFIIRESQAASDSDRLRLFAEFMVTESRIRRDRYSSAFGSMEASDIMDLTRNLWRPQQPSPTSNQGPLTSAHSSIASPPPRPSRTDSMDSFASMSSPMSSSNANFTPRTEPESPASAGSSSGARDTGPWARHQPVLSPIPSMAMSTVPDPDEEDELESRGRAPSRWWESSIGSVGHPHRIERSKRESKYMGLPREAMASLQWQDEPSPSLHSISTPRTGSKQGGEYPPEKVGWHEDFGAGPASTPTYFRPSVPSTPDPHMLDVSRLVTLPPPYPRHYPANDNNHPDLETLRSTLESLRDLNDIVEPKKAFQTKVSQNRECQAQDAEERHTQMRHNIQEQLQLGQMSYASAAIAEEEFNQAEAQSALQLVSQEFASFKPEVMTPLHALLSERITKAAACITQLKAGLVTSADNPSPNQPQEEGDEQPELLEKLNLLKWFFEAREALHRELFALEGENSERYREVILMPFRNGGHEEQMRDAESFFNSDRQQRKVSFEKSKLKRSEQFAKIVEESVSRGVEDQLSAFWDIAPGLLAVVQKVPLELRDCELHIPATEYDENPDYEHFPLLYLHSLLTHAEKSAYQFIESQTNLMCLLHEAHTSVMVANVRLLETQRCGEGEAWQDVTKEMEDCKRAEEQRLTVELKDKVETVESQWREALGSGLAEAKERVEHYLAQMDGWNPDFLE